MTVSAAIPRRDLQPGRRQGRWGLAIGGVLLSVVVLSACGEEDVATKDDSSSSSSSTCHTDSPPKKEAPVAADADVAAVMAKRSKPKVVVPKDPAKELVVTDIIEGVGDEVAAGAEVTVQYVGVSQSDCKEFDASWTRGEPATFKLDQVIAGWGEGLVGMKPGGRRHLVIPSDKAYGDDASGGRPTGTLVFVVDMVSAKTPVTADPAALAEATKRGKPTVTVPSPLPAELTITDDVVGTGTEVTDGMTVVAHYVGVDATGTEFDSSWTRGEPASFGLAEVIPGWTKGLPGMKVGGRRTLVIPADMAYGDSGEGGRPKGTLIFVIDLVGAG